MLLWTALENGQKWRTYSVGHCDTVGRCTWMEFSTITHTIRPRRITSVGKRWRHRWFNHSPLGARQYGSFPVRKSENRHADTRPETFDWTTRALSAFSTRRVVSLLAVFHNAVLRCDVDAQKTFIENRRFRFCVYNDGYIILKHSAINRRSFDQPSGASQWNLTEKYFARIHGRVVPTKLRR